jgi:alkylation response protein AidB-like acyl-CoA dehydrogenase
MIDFELGDELSLLVETTRHFAADQLLPSLREAESTRSVQTDIRRAYSEIGLGGLEIGEALGGVGLACLARCLVNEELGAHDPGAALALDPLGVAVYPVLEFAGDPAVAELRSICAARDVAATGTIGRAILVVEAEDRDPTIPISLEVAWVPADDVAVVVVLGPTTACVIDECISTTAVRGSGLRAAGASHLTVTRARVRASWFGSEGADRARARARLATGSLLLGVLRAACEFSRRYAMERHAFGQPIAHHQALAFLITDMNIALESARLLVHEAAWRLDSGLPAAAEAASAFVECIEAARFIGPNGVQILGGHGFMADFPVEKHMREARALGLLAGGLDLAIEEAGRLVAAQDRPLAIAHLEPGAI